MGKKPINVYVYQNREFLTKTNSMQEAAHLTNVSMTQVRNILLGLTTKKTTKNGFSYHFNKLTEDELEQLDVKDITKTYLKSNGKSCRQVVDKLEFEVNCNDGNVFYISPNREKRIEEFKTFLFSKLYDRWLIIPKNLATLEKLYIREFLKSL